MVTPYERPRSRGSNLVFKSGPLLISSKGIGWKSWKRRWFILTRTSLVFFKDDPNVLPQKGNDVSSTLGGIDLNNSGSVVVRTEKKLLTVLFPDGRTFTLKAETVEDMEEWKIALERALAAAPNAALVMGHDGIFRNDSIDAIDNSGDPGKDRRSVKSLVVGRPILLALEDIDGSPSFLEKALCFIERCGLKTEGILRQSADVDDVERRVRDYEQGRNQFSPDEDAHVISDCIKHVLRELPSSPVPTPCCTALLEAHRLEGKEARVTSMKLAVVDTFPEPNRRLLQRVLRMMRAVASYTHENRMTASAVAACMAPLLLRPLLAGECGLEDDSDISGDNAAQLLAATAAATNAQAIVTTLLEEYDSIFEDSDIQQGPQSPEMYPHVEGSESGESSEDETLRMHEVEGYHDAENDLEGEPEEDPDRALSGHFSESSSNNGNDVLDYKVFEAEDSDAESPTHAEKNKMSGKGWSRSVRLRTETVSEEAEPAAPKQNGAAQASWEDADSKVTSPKGPLASSRGVSLKNGNMKAHASTSGSKHNAIWKLSPAVSKNVPSEIADDSGEEELAIHRLEITRNELRSKIAKEAKGNAILQASLERRKQALHDRRLALEQDVARLQEQLQMERDLRAALEVGLSMSATQISSPQNLDSKTRAELEEIAVVEADVARLKQKVADLHIQLSQQWQQGALSDNSERQQRVKHLQAQHKVLQQELDLTLALCHHEKQKNDEIEGQSVHDDTSALEHVLVQQRNALAEAKEALKAERTRGHGLRRVGPYSDVTRSDWRTLQPPSGPGGRQFAWMYQSDAFNSIEPKNDAVLIGNGSPLTDRINYANGRRMENDAEGTRSQRPSTTSNALAELSTRLDFFKERRSQLMEQLHNLDPTLAAPLQPQDSIAPSTLSLTSP